MPFGTKFFVLNGDVLCLSLLPLLASRFVVRLHCFAFAASIDCVRRALLDLSASLCFPLWALALSILFDFTVSPPLPLSIVFAVPSLDPSASSTIRGELRPYRHLFSVCLGDFFLRFFRLFVENTTLLVMFFLDISFSYLPRI